MDKDLNQDVFEFDERLMMRVPKLLRQWEEYSLEERRHILETWETLRGGIPNIMDRFESEINASHEKLQMVDDWDETVRLMDHIHDYASRINDLNILYRTQPELYLDDKK